MELPFTAVTLQMPELIPDKLQPSLSTTVGECATLTRDAINCSLASIMRVNWARQMTY